jgi:hypothetical protein
MFADEEDGDLGGEPAEDLACGVEIVPFPGGINLFCAG